MNWKGFGRKSFGYPKDFPGVIEESYENISEYSRCPG
jgi:hypothetical protein